MIHVIWADQQINYLFNQGPWWVHSIYDHAINIANTHGFWTLVTRLKPKAPLTCVCNLQSFSTHHLRVGMPCITMNNQIKIGSLILDLSQVSILPYHHDFSIENMNEIEEGFHTLLRWCLNQPINEGAMALFNPTHNVFSQEVVRRIHSILNGELLDIKHLIGCGLGQTPSGDDVLVGMMALAHAMKHFGFIQVITHDCESSLKTTTSVSQMMLRQAFKGQYSEAVTQLIAALKTPHHIHEAASACSKLGHTSGFDTMVGILVYGMLMKKGAMYAQTNPNI
ncbi:MAG: DUF2877 domain-containing protein [Erysipelotrichia bacterium]|nr:DUF2877 domain-containing protein [Erysipelotrichia bacterium]